jgi:electron transport complex protein RnfB
VADNQEKMTRRKFFREGLWGACLAGAGTAAGLSVARNNPGNMVWQIDPAKCIACGNCATYCVLEHSAVKCVQAYAICGYCDLCTGYLVPEPKALDTGAENELCPTGAIKRTYVEDPYYEYTIDESLCNGCGKCVKGCLAFGNGSLFLQTRHDRCKNCNECSIAAACPSQAWKRVPADQPYILKGADLQK